MGIKLTLGMMIAIGGRGAHAHDSRSHALIFLFPNQVFERGYLRSKYLSASILLVAVFEPNDDVTRELDGYKQRYRERDMF